MFPKECSPEGNIDSVEGHSQFYKGMDFPSRGNYPEILRKSMGSLPNFLLIIDIVSQDLETCCLDHVTPGIEAVTELA